MFMLSRFLVDGLESSCSFVSAFLAGMLEKKLGNSLGRHASKKLKAKDTLYAVQILNILKLVSEIFQLFLIYYFII